MSVLGGGPVQVAYGVPDIRQAAKRWISFGAGPFFVRDNIPVDEVTIRGVPGDFDHSSAFGWWGKMMVELITVHHPVQMAAMGLHHLGYEVASFEAASSILIARGWPTVLAGRVGGRPFAFHDARADLGHRVEVYETGPRMRDFAAMVEAAALDWDGTNPVREL